MSLVKKKFYKKWWFWIVVVIVIGGIAKAGSSDEPKKVDGSQPKQEQKQDNSKEEGKTFKIGDTIKVDDYEVRVNKVNVSKGDEVFKPKKGNEFFVVDATVKNISKEDKEVSAALMFKVVDKDGRSYDPAITTEQKGMLEGKVGPGRKITGQYIVEVPKGEKGLELQFDSSLIAGQQIIVKLN